MTVAPAYREIIDFIAGGSKPGDVVRCYASAEAERLVAELIEREKESGLSPDETTELNYFMELEHIIRMARAKARLILASGR